MTVRIFLKYIYSFTEATTESLAETLRDEKIILKASKNAPSKFQGKSFTTEMTINEFIAWINKKL